MDGWVFTLFVFAAFAGGFVSGFSGFAMGLVVSGVWLHIITPIQTAALIAGYGLLTQGYGILKLRQALNWQKIWPLILGTTIGIPIGVILLTYINPVYLRFGVGVLLVLYTIYGLARPAFMPMKIGIAADIAIGVTNGLVADRAGINLSRSMIRVLRECSRRTSLIEPGTCRLPIRRLFVQALRNTRCSRRLRVDEARAGFLFSHSPIVFSATNSARGAVRSSCR